VLAAVLDRALAPAWKGAMPRNGIPKVDHKVVLPKHFLKVNANKLVIEQNHEKSKFRELIRSNDPDTAQGQCP
jgi:hypothetical protein